MHRYCCCFLFHSGFSGGGGGRAVSLDGKFLSRESAGGRHRRTCRQTELAHTHTCTHALLILAWQCHADIQLMTLPLRRPPRCFLLVVGGRVSSFGPLKGGDTSVRREANPLFPLSEQPSEGRAQIVLKKKKIHRDSYAIPVLRRRLAVCSDTGSY